MCFVFLRITVIACVHRAFVGRNCALGKKPDARKQLCVSGMLPDTRRKGKGFFAEKQANR